MPHRPLPQHGNSRELQVLADVLTKQEHAVGRQPDADAVGTDSLGSGGRNLQNQPVASIRRATVAVDAAIGLRVQRIQRRPLAQPLYEVRVGEERATDRDQVGAAAGQRLLGQCLAFYTPGEKGYTDYPALYA